MSFLKNKRVQKIVCGGHNCVIITDEKRKNCYILQSNESQYDQHILDAWCGMNHIVLWTKSDELHCFGDKYFEISIKKDQNCGFLIEGNRIVRIIAGNRNVLLIVRG